MKMKHSIAMTIEDISAAARKQMIDSRPSLKITSVMKLKNYPEKVNRTATRWIIIAIELKSVPFSCFLISKSADTKNPALKYIPSALP